MPSCLLQSPVTNMEESQSQLNSLLFVNCKDGNLINVSDLLIKGADPNSIQDEQSALGVAAANDRLDVLQRLLETKARVNLRENFNGWTALMHAVSHGHERIVKVLIENGADVEVTDKITGKTPLNLAARYGFDSMTKFLISCGAMIESRDNYGCTGLTCAALYGYDSVVQQLIEAGADIDASSTVGITSLMFAALHGHASIVQMLIGAGANLNLVSCDHRTALMFASGRLCLGPQSASRMSIIEELLRAGADASVCDDKGKTFIDYAPEEEFRTQLRELLSICESHQISPLK